MLCMPYSSRSCLRSIYRPSIVVSRRRSFYSCCIKIQPRSRGAYVRTPWIYSCQERHPPSYAWPIGGRHEKRRSSSDSQFNDQAHEILEERGSLWVRDACPCPRCIDPSTHQKLFQTCDLPTNIEAKILQETAEQFEVAWENDIPGYGPDHKSIYQKKALLPRPSRSNGELAGFAASTPNEKIELWNKSTISQKLTAIPYTRFMTSDSSLQRALQSLKRHGLVLLFDLQSSETTIEHLASRIGGGYLRETFYGRTWSVRSIPNAKNIAYTNHHLGLHMDLLYMRDPPGLQLLHCLKNTCPGGESIFADAFHAADAIRSSDNKSHFDVLTKYEQTFHYHHPPSHHYRFTRPVIQLDANDRIEAINWSPPFQATFEDADPTPYGFEQYVTAAHAFASHLQAPEHIFEYRMQEGDCVMFNNRRVVHGRRRFETEAGERWLRGAYADGDGFDSFVRVSGEKEASETAKAAKAKAGESGEGLGRIEGDGRG